MSYYISSNDIKNIRLANGIFQRADLQWYDKFFRFGCLNPSDHLSTTREYIFWTRPDLNILKSDGSLNDALKNDSYFQDCLKRYKPVIEQMQYSLTKKPFVNLLSGMVRSSFEIPSYSCNDIDGSATSYGDQIRYRGSTLTSDADGYEISLEFQDTKYLELYTFLKIYDTYENYKQMGVVGPDDYYIFNQKLHDQMSVYKIIVSEDFETIVFWAKGWGVYPKNIPIDVFSNMDVMTDTLKYSVNFHVGWIDDMDPAILSEFHCLGNNPSYKGGNDTIPLYDISNKSVNGVMCRTPYIVYEKSLLNTPTGGSYKLRWREGGKG